MTFQIADFAILGALIWMIFCALVAFIGAAGERNDDGMNVYLRGAIVPAAYLLVRMIIIVLFTGIPQ